MAEGSSIFESRTSNTSSHDSIINSLQETIDAHVRLVPEVRKDNQEPHEVNLSSPLDQIEELHVQQKQELVSQDETHLTNLTNLPNPMIILDDSSHIEAIDEGKEEHCLIRRRKKGKGLKKHCLIQDFERQNWCDCDKRGDKARVRYLREDMEALRYLGVEEQKKKWIEVYCGFGPVVAKEYDSGCKHDDKEGNYVDFDPRPQFANKKGVAGGFLPQFANKKGVAAGFLPQFANKKGVAAKKGVAGGFLPQFANKKGVAAGFLPQFANKKGVAAGFLGNEADNDGGEMRNTKQVDHISGVNGNDLNGGEEDYYEEGKKGKGLKKHCFVDDFERQSGCDCDKRGDKVRVRYLREDMEALRYLGVEEQKKKWIEVYCGFGPVVAKEYDSGCKHDDKEGNYVDFDPRPQFANKKGVAAGFLGNEADNVGGEMRNTNQVDHVSGVNGNDLDGGEEDYYEDEDSDTEVFSIQRPAFLVTGEPDFDSGPPQDGLEYLRRVRWEAEHIPKVKVAKVERNVLNKEQTVYMPNIPEIAPCPEHIMPSKEWEDVFLADFSELRLALSHDEISTSTFSGETESITLAESFVESVIQENLDFCHTDDGTGAIQENLDFCQTENTNCDLPSLRTILEMEPVARVSMLRKRITSMENVSSLSRNDCAWLFALCAAIDTPLDADTCASFRCLLRKCATLRAQKSCLDDEVIMLNILVTISGKYFGQAESKLV